MPWRGRMGPTQNLFWNYMFLKCVTFLEKSQSMTFSEIKKGGFPVIFNQPQASHFYSTIV